MSLRSVCVFYSNPNPDEPKHPTIVPFLTSEKSLLILLLTKWDSSSSFDIYSSMIPNSDLGQLSGISSNFLPISMFSLFGFTYTHGIPHIIECRSLCI